jgi:hypothetical protein
VKTDVLHRAPSAARLSTMGPSTKYGVVVDEVAVVVLVAMMLSKSLWTLMQESPAPLSSIA